jgi:hypothetical protein
MFPEQRHIMKFLRIKGLKLGEITKELSSAHSPDAYTPPSIKCWPRQIKLGRTDPRAQHAGGRPLFHDINAEILSLLRKYPFSSVRTIAESREIPVSTIFFIWSRKLVLKISYFVGSRYPNQRIAAEASRTLKSVTLDAWKPAESRFP